MRERELRTNEDTNAARLGGPLSFMTVEVRAIVEDARERRQGRVARDVEAARPRARQKVLTFVLERGYAEVGVGHGEAARILIRQGLSRLGAEVLNERESLARLDDAYRAQVWAPRGNRPFEDLLASVRARDPQLLSVLFKALCALVPDSTAAAIAGVFGDRKSAESLSEDFERFGAERFKEVLNRLCVDPGGSVVRSGVAQLTSGITNLEREKLLICQSPGVVGVVNTVTVIIHDDRWRVLSHTLPELDAPSLGLVKRTDHVPDLWLRGHPVPSYGAALRRLNDLPTWEPVDAKLDIAPTGMARIEIPIRHTSLGTPLEYVYWFLRQSEPIDQVFLSNAHGPISRKVELAVRFLKGYPLERNRAVEFELFPSVDPGAARKGYGRTIQVSPTRVHSDTEYRCSLESLTGSVSASWSIEVPH